MSYNLDRSNLGKLAIPILLILSIGLVLNFAGQGPNAFSASSTQPDKTSLNTLFSVSSCTFSGYDDCITDTFTEGTASATATLGWDRYSSPSESESLEYSCRGDKAVLATDSGYTVTQMIDNYNDLSFDVGTEVPTTGSIPFTEIENGYTLICASSETSGSDIASGFIWIEDSSIDVQSEEEESIPTNAEVSTGNSNPVVNQDVSFDASGSSGEGSLSYYWYIEESGSTIGASESITHSFDRAGSYTVVVEVTSESGETDTASVNVDVGSGVSASASVYSDTVERSDSAVVSVGDTVTFDAGGSDGSGLSYEWYFEGSPGDTVSVDSSFDYTFIESGERTMIVEVTDSYGNSDSSSVSVVVEPVSDGGDDGTGDDKELGFFEGIIDWFMNLF